MYVCSVYKDAKVTKIGLKILRKSQCTVPVMLTGGWCAGECDGEQVAAPAGHTRPSQSQGTVCLLFNRDVLAYRNNT
jgi:hypothetical protein